MRTGVRSIRQFNLLPTQSLILCLCLGVVSTACRPATVLTSTPLLESTLTTVPLATREKIQPTPTAASTSVPTSTPFPTPTSHPVKIWIEPEIKDVLLEIPSTPQGGVLVEAETEADIKIQVGQSTPLGNWVFIVSAAFPTLRDEITWHDLEQAWKEGVTENTAGKPLLMSQATAQFLSLWLGPPHPDGIKIMESQKILEEAWNDRSSLAILPFEELGPRWKVLTLDGQSPLQKDFDPQAYPLAVPIGATSSGSPVQKTFTAALEPNLSNYNPAKLTNVTLTGVTALVRGTALTMEARGITYPAQDIRGILMDADILHISNEIPFYSECPPPELYPAEIRFCSAQEYIQLLENIGADVIELDGDHFGDYGIQAMQETLKMYQERGWEYYGGGANDAEARQAVLLSHHGNQLAFIGCNAKGIAFYATANETTPGAVQCDFDWLTAEIGRLKAAGYLVIATFQHNEYYRYEAQPDLIRDFQKAAQAGAVIVSGSQAHQPHGMEFFQDSFIHYGLGNLFFDQYRYFPGPELDRAFIDRHFFYNQRYINTEILTIQFVDLARSRQTTAEERVKLLDVIFKASGW